MSRKNGLSGNIILSTAVFFLFQACLYAVTMRLANAPLTENFLFIPVSLVVHGALAAFLLSMQGSFVIDATGERLSHVNTANLLTMVRISSTPTLMFLLLKSNRYCLMPVIVILMGCIFITDALDGFISRVMRQVTGIGKMLDSISDYTILFHVAIALVWLGYLPLWYFILLLIRLFFQAIGQLTFLISRGKVEAKPTLLGKAAIASAMSLFGFEVLRAIWKDYPPELYIAVEALAGCVIFASIFDKAMVFARRAKTEPKIRRQSTT